MDAVVPGACSGIECTCGPAHLSGCHGFIQSLTPASSLLDDLVREFLDRIATFSELALDLLLGCIGRGNPEPC